MCLSSSLAVFLLDSQHLNFFRSKSRTFNQILIIRFLSKLSTQNLWCDVLYDVTISRDHKKWWNCCYINWKTWFWFQHINWEGIKCSPQSRTKGWQLDAPYSQRVYIIVNGSLKRWNIKCLRYADKIKLLSLSKAGEGWRENLTMLVTSAMYWLTRKKHHEKGYELLYVGSLSLHIDCKKHRDFLNKSG